MNETCNQTEPEAPPWATQAEFIRVWQTSRTVREVCSRLGMSRATVKQRAWRYRNWHGVPLKELEFDPAIEADVDWEALAKYAEELITAGEKPSAAAPALMSC
jgi:hypothetical protein